VFFGFMVKAGTDSPRVWSGYGLSIQKL
jgi:hypothetical protein